MTVSCEYVAERLSAYIDGECSAEEEMNIRAHLETCKECAALLDALKNASVWTTEAADVEIPETLHADIIAAVEEVREKQKSKKIHFTRRWSTVAVAASLLLCVFGTVISYVVSEKRLWDARNSIQNVMPVQQGFVYDMQTKWNGNPFTFSIPKEIRLYQDGNQVWKTKENTGMQWMLEIDVQEGTAVLSNALIKWEGIVSSSEKKIPTKLQFGNLTYQVKKTSGGITLLLEET